MQAVDEEVARTLDIYFQFTTISLVCCRRQGSIDRSTSDWLTL